jgi:hypothetical protein
MHPLWFDKPVLSPDFIGVEGLTTSGQFRSS